MLLGHQGHSYQKVLSQYTPLDWFLYSAALDELVLALNIICLHATRVNMLT